MYEDCKKILQKKVGGNMPPKKIILISICLILFILFFKFILYPAHISVIANCNQEKFKTDYPTFQVDGSFSVNYTENSTEPILTTYLRDEENIPLKMHEFCHEKEFEYHVLFGCQIRALNLLSEIPCYTVQRYYEIKGLF